ncbi:MAG: hypothetical protein ABFD23_04570 [Caldisericales bacterium]|nr:hypothetical protein [bacterium]
MHTKYKVLSVLALIALSCSALAIAKTGQQNVFPILPANSCSYGGNIDITCNTININDSYDRYNVEGIILDPELNQVTKKPLQSYNNIFYNLGDHLNSIFNIKHDSKPEPDIIQIMNSSYSDSNGEENNACLKSAVLFGKNVRYNPTLDLFIYSENTNKYLFFNGTNLKKLFGYGGKIEDLRGIAKNIALIDGKKVVDLENGQVLFQLSGNNLMSDGAIIVTNDLIYGIKERNIIANISSMNFKPSRIYKDRIESYYLDDGQFGKVSPTIKRIARDGSLLEIIRTKIAPYDIIKGTYGHLALCFGNATSGKYGNKAYKLIEMSSGTIIFEADFSETKAIQADIIGSKLLLRSEKGAQIYEIDGMKEVGRINFPAYPQFISDGKDTVVLLPQLDGGVLGYKLDNNLNVIPWTQTKIPDAKEYYLEDGTIYAVTTTINPYVSNNRLLFYLNSTEISCNKLGSQKAASTYSFTLDTPQEGYMASTFADGKYYMVRKNGELSVFDCREGGFIQGGNYVGGDFFRARNPPDGLSGKPSLLVSNDRVFLLHPGKINWLLCFDKSNGNLIFDKRFELGGPYVDKPQIRLFGEALIMESPSGVYFLNDDTIIGGDGLFIGISNGKAIFSDNGKTKFIDLSTKDTGTIEISDIYKSAIPFFGFNDGILAPDGNVRLIDNAWVQKQLGTWFSFKSDPQKNLLSCKNDTTIPGGTLAHFEPCPSFSVKRIKPESGANQESVTFEFTMTRTDGLADVWKGEACLVAWGDDGKAPVFAKLNEPRHKLGPLLPGMSQEITFKLPDKDSNIQNITQAKESSNLKYFALVVESNGLMDREKSVLSEYDKDPRPLFDGTPVALDQQKAIVVTVWEK